MAIHDAIKAYSGPKKCVIESAAFSIASFIACACDEVEITENGWMMMHNPAVKADGDDETLEHSVGLLKKLKASMVSVYSSRSGMSEPETLAMMRDETYYNAKEAIARGFATRVLNTSVPSKVVAQNTNLPHRAYVALFGNSGGNHNKEDSQMSEPKTPVAATVSEIRSSFPKAKAEFVLKCIERQMPMASVAAYRS